MLIYVYIYLVYFQPDRYYSSLGTLRIPIDVVHRAHATYIYSLLVPFNFFFLKIGRSGQNRKTKNGATPTRQKKTRRYPHQAKKKSATPTTSRRATIQR